MTGTFASRAFFTSAAIFGTEATHVGRGGQITEVMSRTSRAAPFTGTSTATGSGILGIGDVGAAEAELVLAVVVVGAVVVHDREHRQLQICCGPKRARIEQQVAVGLDVHDELSVAAMRERDAERDPDLRRRTQAAARPAHRRVDVPELRRPVLEVGASEHPVLAFDRVPNLAGKTRGPDR